MKFCQADKRKESLDGLEFADELSMVGAYKDDFEMFNRISCYQCGLLFNVEEIQQLSSHKKLSFLTASWVFHARSNPWCEFLKNTKSKYCEFLLKIQILQENKLDLILKLYLVILKILD